MTSSLLYPILKSLVALGNFANINGIRPVRVHNTAMQCNAMQWIKQIVTLQDRSVNYVRKL